MSWLQTKDTYELGELEYKLAFEYDVRPDMSVKQGICLCLIYLRQKPIFEILGLLFDVSKTKANDTFNYWIEILREILPLRVRQSLQRGEPPQRAGSPASQIEEVSESEEKYQKLRQSLLEYELIVDSAEQPIERPVDYQEQKKYYSGKKKMHTLKNQFIVLPKQGQSEMTNLLADMID